MRVNPRTTLLAALQEGPLPERHLGTLLWQRTLIGGRKLTDREIEARLQRHLCHLVRSRQVVRLASGRYELRYPPVYEGCLHGKGCPHDPTVKSRVAKAVRVAPGEDLKRGMLVYLDGNGQARRYP